MSPPRRVAIHVPDLFFATRIAAVAAGEGVAVVPVSPDSAAATLREHPVSLVILDLSAGGGALDLARALRGDPATAALPIVGFYPHVDRDLRDRALAAGVDPVLPRSAFTLRLAALLRGAT
jgi:CheY-like chemotaxis protein